MKTNMEYRLLHFEVYMLETNVKCTPARGNCRGSDSLSFDEESDEFSDKKYFLFY